MRRVVMVLQVEEEDLSRFSDEMQSAMENGEGLTLRSAGGQFVVEVDAASEVEVFASPLTALAKEWDPSVHAGQLRRGLRTVGFL